MNYTKYKRIERNRRVLRWFRWLCHEVSISPAAKVSTYLWPYTEEDELKLKLVKRYMNATIDFYEKPSLFGLKDIQVRIVITK